VPPRVEYSLTPIGEAFRPVLDSIETWGNAYIAYLKEKNSGTAQKAQTP
jgi:DNA-binding HxlR family transcriptional regulator